MTAPDLSPTEAEIVARFDAAPTLPEAYTPLSALLDQLDQLRAAGSTDRTWHVEEDSCDCGDGYGCPHGSWPYAIHGPVNVSYADQPEHPLRGRVTGIDDLSDADAALIVAAVNAVGPLTAAVRAVLELADELDTNEPGLSWLVLRRRERLDAWVKARDVADRIRAAIGGDGR